MLLKLKFIKIILLIYGLIILASCNYVGTFSSDVPKQYRFELANAERNLNTHPDSVLQITTSIIKSADSLSLNKAFLLKLYLLKQQAFSRLRKMDSVLALGETIRAVAENLNDSIAIAESLLPVKGDIDFRQQKKLAVYLPGAIHTFSVQKMPFKEARLRAMYGAILIQSGNVVEAQAFLLKAYDMIEKMDSLKYLTSISINIGNNYQRLRNEDLALQYYNRALNFSRKFQDSLSSVSVLMNIGIFYSQIKLDSAEIYYRRAMNFLPKKGSSFLQMKLEYNMAVAAYKVKKYKQSADKFQEMLTNCLKNNQTEGYANALNGLAKVYLETNQLPLAITAGKRAFFVFDSLGLPYDALRQSEDLVSMFEKSGNVIDEIREMKVSKKLNDSLMSAEKELAVHDMEDKYQSEKKVMEIRHLNKEISIRHIGILILVIVALFLYVLWRRTRLLYKERRLAFDALMHRYKLERGQRLTASKKAIKEKQALPIDNSLAISPSLALMDSLKNWFETEKPFLDEAFKAEDIANYLQLNQRELVNFLKEKGYQNISDLVNRYRIEEVKILFDDRKNDNLTFEAIARQAGFGSKQTFFSVFQKYVGMTPSYYRSQIRNNHSSTAT